MAYHCFAYSGSVGTTANTAINAVSDGIFYIQNSHIVPPKDLYLYAVAACSATAQRARLISPSIRQIANSHIRPINVGAQFPDNPKLMPYWDNPLRLRGLEELIVDFTSGTGTSETCNVVGFAGDGIDPVPTGDIIVIRATGTTTLVAGAWTPVPLTYDDVLPSGTYKLVGATFQGATCLAGRLTFDNQFFRPGALGITALGNTEHIAFETRRLGVWGTFRSTSLPRLEYLSTAADTTQTVYMQIVRVGN